MNKVLASLKNIWGRARRGDLSGLNRYSDLALPLAMMFLIGTFFIPLPTYILSALLVANLALSFVVLATSLYLRTPLELTSYPTILLITTLFRLCLSVSVSRSILSEGHAGDVIEALGRVTAGGNIIIGAVLFLLILVVQFIVVAKGSERVAEVAARFTLDALPGKQMAIDADLRAGLINQDQAREMRVSLQKESQLYGAMDGAMKFVKGDSIATIVIALINIAGGIATGVLLNNLSLLQAVQKYTILTIGDGLAAIISSMLVTVSAGIVVTRVSTGDEDSNVGADISQQLFTNPKPLGVAAGLLLALSLLPRMPFVPFFVAGLGLAGFAYSITRARRRAEREEAERQAKAGSLASARDELEPTFTVPLAVIVSENIGDIIDKTTPVGFRFCAELPKLRSALYYDTGVMLPNVYLSKAPLKPNQYSLVIKETPVAYATLQPDSVYVNDSAENIKVFGLEGEDVRNPADLKPGAWIPAAQRQIAELAGLKVWEPHEVIVLHLSHVMRQYAHEFIGIQEAQALLDFTARGLPKLVEEVVPKTISVHQFTDVLQRLVQENISIRDLKTVLESLSEWGRIEKDPVMLTEFVRSSLKRSITFRHTGGRDTLFVYLLDQEIEDVIRGSIRKTATGSFLSLDPAIAQDIIAAIRREVGELPSTAQKPVVITDMELRRFVRKMVELEFPQLSVLSYQELTPDLSVQPVGRITLQPAAQNFFAEPAGSSAGLLTAAR